MCYFFFKKWHNVALKRQMILRPEQLRNISRSKNSALPTSSKLRFFHVPLCNPSKKWYDWPIWRETLTCRSYCTSWQAFIRFLYSPLENCFPTSRLLVCVLMCLFLKGRQIWFCGGWLISSRWPAPLRLGGGVIGPWRRKGKHLSNGYHSGLVIRMQGSNSPILGSRGQIRKAMSFQSRAELPGRCHGVGT